MAVKLALLDYLVLAVYLVGTVGLGLAIGRGMKTGKDYFLAGRNLPWWAIGMSLVATDISGTDIIGVGGAAYSHGLAVANFEWIGCVPAMIVAAFVFIPHFWRIGVYTIPEFMERRFNVAVRSVLAFCWLAFMACNLGVMLFASAKMMTVSLGLNFGELALLGVNLGGYEIALCIVAFAIVVGVYTFAGGLAAVVYTDTIQCAVMIGGCLLVLVIGLANVGGFGRLAERVEAREAELRKSLDHAGDRPAAGSGQAARRNFPRSAAVGQHNELILPVETESPFPWPGIFWGLALVLSPAYWFGNQAIVQRSLGARSEFHAKASYVWGALLKNVIPVVIALPGLVAFALLPDLKTGDDAFPALATKLLPAGLRGVFLAAFLAALMSSVDSYLNSAATIFTHDLYKRFVQTSDDDKRLLLVGRLTTLVLIVWAVRFALWCSTIDQTGIYAIFQTLMSFFQGPALAILLAGVFWPRANGTGAFCGFIVGVLTSVALFTLNLPAVYRLFGWEPLFRIDEPFLYLSVWAFLVAVAVIVVVSLATEPQPADKVAPLIYRRRREKS